MTAPDGRKLTWELLSTWLLKFMMENLTAEKQLTFSQWALFFSLW